MDCQFKNVRKFCGSKGLEFFERYMGEMTNSLINEHCVGYTFQDKCLGKDSLSQMDELDPSVKSMLVLGASANRASSRFSGHQHQSRTILGKISSPLIGWFVLVMEVLAKVVASVTVSGTIYWVLIEYHFS